MTLALFEPEGYAEPLTGVRPFDARWLEVAVRRLLAPSPWAVEIQFSPGYTGSLTHELNITDQTSPAGVVSVATWTPPPYTGRILHPVPVLILRVQPLEAGSERDWAAHLEALETLRIPHAAALVQAAGEMADMVTGPDTPERLRWFGRFTGRSAAEAYTLLMALHGVGHLTYYANMYIG